MQDVIFLLQVIDFCEGYSEAANEPASELPVGE